MGTHGGNTASGPMVTQPMPGVQASVRIPIPWLSAAAGGGAKVGGLGLEPPATRMPVGCVTTRPLFELRRTASLLLGAVSATDKKQTVCICLTACLLAQ